MFCCAAYHGAEIQTRPMGSDNGFRLRAMLAKLRKSPYRPSQESLPTAAHKMPPLPRNLPVATPSCCRVEAPSPLAEPSSSSCSYLPCRSSLSSRRAFRLQLLLSAAQKLPLLPQNLPPPAALICRVEAPSPLAEPSASSCSYLPCRSFLPSRGAFLLQLRLYAAERAVVLHAGTRQAFCRFASIARAGNPLSEPYGRVRISRAS